MQTISLGNQKQPMKFFPFHGCNLQPNVIQIHSQWLQFTTVKTSESCLFGSLPQSMRATAQEEGRKVRWPLQHGAWQSTDTIQRTERTGYGKGEDGRKNLSLLSVQSQKQRCFHTSETCTCAGECRVQVSHSAEDVQTRQMTGK